MSLIIEQKIEAYLKTEKIVKTKKLEKIFELTNSTLRRYLINLEKKNIIKRSFGEIIYCQNDEIFKDRFANEVLNENVENKKKIAKTAAILAKGYKNIYLDSGSNCFYLLEYLEKDVSIYTNSIINANKAIAFGFRNVNILGGRIKKDTMGIVELDDDFVKKINFSIAFMGVNGLSNKERLTTPEKQEGIVKKQIASKSQLVVCLCEKEKFGIETFYDFTPENSRIIIVTDKQNINKKHKFSYISTKERK